MSGTFVDLNPRQLRPAPFAFVYCNEAGSLDLSDIMPMTYISANFKNLNPFIQQT